MKYVDPDGKNPLAIVGITRGTSELITAGLVATAVIITATGYENLGGTVNSAANWINNNINQPLINTITISATTPTSSSDIQGEGINQTTIALSDASDVNTSINTLLDEKTNPYKGPVDKQVIIVDKNGNAIPVNEGERIKESKDRKWVDVKKADGTSTGTRIDDGHPNHTDPRGQNPHADRPGKTNPDGTPWLPLK